MVKLYASHNSEFFAVREPGRLHLFKESFPDVTHRVHDQMAGELIHLSDSGDCFFRSEEGLFRLRREKGVRAERCKAVKDLDGSPENGILKGFAVRADGEQVAYEQVLPAQKFSSKLRRFLGKKSAQGDVGPRLHRFVVSQWSGRSSTCYYETIIDPRTSAGLVWWISADFGYLSVMERERDGQSILRLIDILDESVVNELLVDGRLSRDRHLTSNGSVGFGLEKDGKRVFVIWTYAQERFGVTYPKDSRVLHLGRDKIVFQSRKQEIVIVKDYKNQLLAEINLSALSRLGVQYLLSFNTRGSVELVTYHGGKLRVHHTDIDSLPIDARRWELLGERRRAEQLENQAQAVIEKDEQARDNFHQQVRQERLQTDLSDNLAASGQDALHHPLQPIVAPPSASLPLESLGQVRQQHPETAAPKMSPPEPDTASRPEVTFVNQREGQEALERLRMRYIAGELTREDYYNEKTLIERACARLPACPEPKSVQPQTLDFLGE